MEILIGIWVCFMILAAIVHEVDSDDSFVRNRLDNRRRIKEFRKKKKDSWERGIIYDPRTTYQIDIDGLIAWEKQFKILAGDDYIPAATSLFPEMKPYLAEVVSPIVHDTKQDSHNDVMAVLTGAISKDEYNKRMMLSKQDIENAQRMGLFDPNMAREALQEIKRTEESRNMYVVDENGAMKAAPKSAQGDHNRYRELWDAHAELQRDSFIPPTKEVFIPEAYSKTTTKESKSVALPSHEREQYLNKHYDYYQSAQMWPKLYKKLIHAPSGVNVIYPNSSLWSLVDAYGYGLLDDLEDQDVSQDDLIVLLRAADNMPQGYYEQVRWESKKYSRSHMRDMSDARFRVL